jgi:hypothetical protein
MARVSKLFLVRLLPVLFITAAAMAYVSVVEGRDGYAIRNVMPMLVLIGLSIVTLYRGGGSWIGAGWCWPLGTAGFAIPALGLSLYLHYGYSVNLDDMFSNAADPQALFRYLPLYTIVAGTIGFAIGWIVGRNV